MERPLRLLLVSTSGKSLDVYTASVRLPTEVGSVGILAGHAPMLCEIRPGILQYVTEGDGAVSLEVDAGIARVSNGEVQVLLRDFEDGT